MELKTRAIAIHAYPYGDTGRVLKVLTEEEGMISILLRSAGTKRSASRLVLFQPMNRLGLVLKSPKSSGLYMLKESWLDEPRPEWIHDPVRSCLSMFYAEAVLRSVSESDPDSDFFSFLWQWMDITDVAPHHSDLPIRFLLELGLHLGVSPQASESGDHFDLREGHFVLGTPRHPEFLEPEQAQLLRSFLSSSLEQHPGRDASRASRLLLLEGLITYLQLHLEHFKGLRSLKVLEAIFD